MTTRISVIFAVIITVVLMVRQIVQNVNRISKSSIKKEVLCLSSSSVLVLAVWVLIWQQQIL